MLACQYAQRGVVKRRVDPARCMTFSVACRATEVGRFPPGRYTCYTASQHRNAGSHDDRYHVTQNLCASGYAKPFPEFRPHLSAVPAKLPLPHLINIPLTHRQDAAGSQAKVRHRRRPQCWPRTSPSTSAMSWSKAGQRN